MSFILLKEAVQQKLDNMTVTEFFITDVDKDEMWELYLNSFPAGTNEIYRERRAYDCSCCRQFIKNIGNVVTIKNGELVSMWDITVGSYYQPVADALSAYVKSKPILNVFRSKEHIVGTDHNHENDNGSIKRWEHFYYKLPKQFLTGNRSVGDVTGDFSSSKNVLERSLTEITDEAIETVLELINENQLYRGQEHLHTVEKLSKVKKEYGNISYDKDLFLWKTSTELGFESRFRNTVIGTLLIDLSEGESLTKAVKSFEAKVAPSNYKRPKALITQGMIKKAQEKVTELGYTPSLKRRFAVAKDVSVNNVLFADRSTKSKMLEGDIFDDLTKEISDNKPNSNKVEDINIDDFLNNILPDVNSLELFVENRHTGNMMSLVSPVEEDAKNIFKWDNNFSWSYKGEVTDSLKEAVREAGGNVDGDLVFSHTWNYDGKNQSLMDLHVFMPGCGYKEPTKVAKEIHDNYPNSYHRVGWNARKNDKTGGVQDVDFVNPPGDNVPVENISFPDVKRMPEGKYIFKIHNWQFRSTTTSGFKARIAFGEEVYHYEYDKPVENKEWITLANATLKDGKFTIEHVLKDSAQSKEVWGINTCKWQKVSMLMNSPNHWDGNETGNKHLFFILDECKNPDSARGFYNEFLSAELTPHRKVLEVLSSKMKTEKSDEQLSGLGFSTTKKDAILCRVGGKLNRVINITF